MHGCARIADLIAAPGETAYGQLNLGQLADGSQVGMAVAVLNGAHDGPRMFLTAGVHATETEGVEAARRIIRLVDPKALHGVLIVVPVVNVLGFRTSPGARYSPVWLEEEAREVDNSFPGNRTGSAIDRATAVIADEIISGSDFGIDFHCGRISIVNLPHVRTYAADKCPDPELLASLMATFGTEIVLSIPRPRNNIQMWASMRGIPTIMVESGGGLAPSEEIVQGGVEGVLNFMTRVGMLDRPAKEHVPTIRFVDECGVIAPAGGFFESSVSLGERVAEGQKVGQITDLFGRVQADVIAPKRGTVFGVRIAPTAFEGVKVMNIGMEAADL